MVDMFDTVLRQAWQRSEGKCQCTRIDHGHPYVRCNKRLVWERQDKLVPGGWRIRKRIGYGKNATSACEILCWECFQKAIQEL